MRSEEAEVDDPLANLLDQMGIHENARLTPVRRETLVRRLVRAGRRRRPSRQPQAIARARCASGLSGSARRTSRSGFRSIEQAIDGIP